MAFRAKFLHFKTKASYQAERTRQENAGTVNDFDKYISFVDEGPTLYTWEKEYSGAEIEDVLTSTSADKSLSANMGRVLNESIDLRNVAAVNSGNVIDTEAIPTVQPKLTVEVKANGNIVLGNLEGESKEFMPATPSGDPMHYAYEAAGAVWNASTGYWEMYDMKDVTNEQIRKAVLRGHWEQSQKSPFTTGGTTRLSAVRFNIARIGTYNADVSAYNAKQFAYYNSTMEVCNLTTIGAVRGQTVAGGAWLRSLNLSFTQATNLRMIIGVLICNSVADTTKAFEGCAKLQNIRLSALQTSISFSDSPLLSKESLLYMINNCASGATFTIILHADVYAKCVEGGEWYSDVSTALASALSDKTTTITLASA